MDPNIHKEKKPTKHREHERRHRERSCIEKLSVPFCYRTINKFMFLFIKTLPIVVPILSMHALTHLLSLWVHAFNMPQRCRHLLASESGVNLSISRFDYNISRIQKSHIYRAHSLLFFSSVKGLKTTKFYHRLLWIINLFKC